MMIDPPQSKGSDEICPICQRPKSRHTHEEMSACSRKLQESKKDSADG